MMRTSDRSYLRLRNLNYGKRNAPVEVRVQGTNMDSGEVTGDTKWPGSVWLAIEIPKGFFPVEDIGQLSVTTEAGA